MEPVRADAMDRPLVSHARHAACHDANVGFADQGLPGHGDIAGARTAPPPELTPVRGAERIFAGSLIPKSFLILCIFCFWSQFNPSEPFLVDYMVASKGFTNAEIYNRIFDIFVYSHLPCLLVVGLLAELPFCGGNRSVLVCGAACGLATTALTRFTNALAAQQVAQLFIAANFASRFALFAVTAALVRPAELQRSVHLVRAVVLVSNACSALLGEVVRDVAQLRLGVLFEMAVAAQALSFIFALALPRRKRHVRVLRIQGGLSELEHGSAAGLADTAQSVAAVVPPATFVGGLLSALCAPPVDLWRALRLRAVLWYVAWYLAMNPAHALMLTYWQNLVAAKSFARHDRNGYHLATMYLAAAAFTAASHRSGALREHPAAMAVASVFGGGFASCLAAACSTEVFFYLCLDVYQCIFEVMTAAFTFQVTAALMEAAAAVSENGRTRQPRLTLVLCATGVIGGLIEMAAQALLRNLWSIEVRFVAIGVTLCCWGGVLLFMAAAEACLSAAQGRSGDA
mmetsp:Transcript_19693/g.54076  ORF Transcript_19693/g.54076 Transcript_19693/m.54076 type:complete len:515 (-) Transcript_19693:163-1707(-)